jgi:hypothetical protein
MARLNQTLENTIYNWVVSAVSSKAGITVIWDKQSSQGAGQGVQPSEPFMTLNFISGPNKVGTPEQVDKPGVEDTITRIFRKTVTLSVQVFAFEDYLEIMSLVINATELDSKLDILRAQGIAIWGVSNINDLSELTEAQYRFRANIDIIIAYGEEIDDVTGQINTVEMTGQVGSQDRDIDIS